MSGFGVCPCWSVVSLGLLPDLTRLRRGLTFAESPGVVDVLLAHIAHSFPLEGLLCEGVAPCLGELQTHTLIKLVKRGKQ